MSMNNGEYGRRAFKVTIIVRAWLKDEAAETMTVNCLESLRNAGSLSTDCHVILVAGGGRCDCLGSGATTVHLPENMGAVRATNVGLQLALLDPSEFVLVLDNDTEFPEGDSKILERWMRHFDEAAIGAVGAVSDYVSGSQRVDVAPMSYTKDFDGGHAGVLESPYLVSFACMYRKSALRKMPPAQFNHAAIDAIRGGGLRPDFNVLADRHLWDERFEPGNSEDLDVSVRLRLAGYRLLVARDVYVHHHGSVSFLGVAGGETGFSRLLNENQRKFHEKWGQYVQG